VTFCVALGGPDATVSSMPISWGTIPTSSPATSGYDIEQYCRFFDNRGNNLNFARNAGLWTVMVIDEGNVVASSNGKEVLFDALNECYLIVRGLLPAQQ
jgi:hypothetical protein